MKNESIDDNSVMTEKLLRLRADSANLEPPSARIKAMKMPRFQFTTRGILWAVFWIGLGVMLCQVYWRQVQLTDNQGDFLSQIGDVALTLVFVPIGGLIGTFLCHPMIGAFAGFAVWLIFILLFPAIQQAR